MENMGNSAKAQGILYAQVVIDSVPQALQVVCHHGGLNSLGSKRGSSIVNTNYSFHQLGSLTFDFERSYFSQVEVL